MITAILLAAGNGQRMTNEIPKQFLHVYDKPILVYTLEVFQATPEIDNILVVCLDGWEALVSAYAKQYGISKLKWIVKGGALAQESIRDGIFHLEEVNACKDDDMIVIHDGIRPLVDADLIASSVVTCIKNGNGVSSLPYNEQIFVTEDWVSSTRYIPRDKLRRMMTPQCYPYAKLLAAYKKAFTENIGVNGSAYANTLLADLGETLYMSKGSDKNIKITTQDDLDLFKGYRAHKRRIP
jgi:2-C-methyl-D-erythritol 4-phosphate cytidylyltransferase